MNAFVSTAAFGSSSAMVSTVRESLLPLWTLNGIVKGDDVIKYCNGEPDITPEAAADTAPVSDSGSASPTTGNASSAIMISVISAAGIAAIASKKRK